MKKKYVAPKIVVRGTIEEITQGSGWGIRDFFVFGITDAIGNMGRDNARQAALVSS
jgi:hypothetical protein